MFRKNPEAITEWSREHVKACAERQLSILQSAAKAVKVGGTLVYSTCTFSREENEGVIQAFLSAHPDFEAVPIQEPFGRSTGVPCGVRITPMEGGEGHFAAKLRRITAEEAGFPVMFQMPTKPDKKLPEILAALSDILTVIPQERLYLMNDKVFFLPQQYPDSTGLGVIRAGVFAGEVKKNRFEPSHALFMATPPSQCRRVLSLSVGDARVGDFLQGLEIDCDTENGYTAPNGACEMLSCIYHSLAERYREVLDMLQEVSPFKIEKLHVIGGGSANDLLNQWTADAIGIPVVAGPTEATALGNLMVQAKAAGLVKDRWTMRKMIAQNFKTKTYNPAP